MYIYQYQVGPNYMYKNQPHILQTLPIWPLEAPKSGLMGPFWAPKQGLKSIMKQTKIQWGMEECREGRGGPPPFEGPKMGQICTEWLHEEALVQQQSDIGRFFVQKVVACFKNKNFKILPVFPFQIASGVAQKEASSPFWGVLWAHKGSLSTLLVPKRAFKSIVGK